MSKLTEIPNYLEVRVRFEDWPSHEWIKFNQGLWENQEGAVYSLSQTSLILTAWEEFKELEDPKKKVKLYQALYHNCETSLFLHTEDLKYFYRNRELVKYSGCKLTLFNNFVMEVEV